MNRRDFLGGVAAGAVAAGLPGVKEYECELATPRDFAICVDEDNNVTIDLKKFSDGSLPNGWIWFGPCCCSGPKHVVTLIDGRLERIEFGHVDYLGDAVYRFPSTNRIVG